MPTLIRWAEETWNPATGCVQITEGCEHCYAKTLAEQKRGTAAFPVGFDAMMRPWKIDEPRKRKAPTVYFVNSMSDLHLGAWPTEFLDQVYDVMLENPRHIFIVLTKRPRRMRDYLVGTRDGTFALADRPPPHVIPQNLLLSSNGYLARRRLRELPAHIWLGATIEKDLYTFRADVLREIPTAGARTLSLEPLLEPLPSLNLDGIGWVIVGGESGPGHRPMDHAWATDLRDRSIAAGAAFFFKQSAAARTEMGQLLNGTERWEQRPTNGRESAIVYDGPMVVPASPAQAGLL